VLQEFQGKLLPADSREVKLAQRVMRRIARAVEIKPLQREINLRLDDYFFEWEVNVIEDRQVNAFCLPAGKMCLFTGILAITKTEDQLATVMSHEMSHALAHHASERVAREQAGGENILRKLSYDRAQEAEADHVGVFLMALADYDPEEAVKFWTRMRESKGGRGGPLEWLSDHPTDEHRIASLARWAPRAKAARRAYDRGNVVGAGK